MTTLIPAYGRDYKSAAAVTKDWKDGKDFTICDISNPYDGKYASIRDFQGQRVMLRYAKLTKVTIVQC